ncbi:MAG: lactate utilization protein [Deltaproteobacteria bacterium]|nr:lactate utilization protein [Deltaproteobacteria bacterium]MBW1949467.1 lactate utilization protein [Deltaproteobacteria bacterium]MBW2007621.1 lactate utilization protein [Deltaproteobacteria bacterium]MBW2103407.1 lactate utilization protein [Deltaproteobacteria bacterium]MBW2347331.1 lactate utilization protein [Deltaproteobacteria bacterium]
MEKPIDAFWLKRLEDLKEALEANHFEVHITQTAASARELFLEEILPGLEVKTVSWGGSMTFMATGLYEIMRDDDRYEVLDAFKRDVPREELIEIRRQALLADLFLTGTNAVTEDGQLVNLDMIGNRVCGITFGPRHVVIFVGRNKIVSDLDEAMVRVKNYVAPVNAMRLDMKTPCVNTGYCEECNSPQRICNTWTITEKSFPKGRVKVVLINEDLGF